MTVEEYARLPREGRLARLARTPGELAAAIARRSDDALSRRPDATNWAAKEVLCHLRDNEESFLDRLRMMVAMDEPRFPRSNRGLPVPRGIVPVPTMVGGDVVHTREER